VYAVDIYRRLSHGWVLFSHRLNLLVTLSATAVWPYKVTSIVLATAPTSIQTVSPSAWNFRVLQRKANRIRSNQSRYILFFTHCGRLLFSLLFFSVILLCYHAHRQSSVLFFRSTGFGSRALNKLGEW